MHTDCTVRTLMTHCTHVNNTAPQMNSIIAQIVPCTHKKSNSSLSSSIESVGFLYTTFSHLFYGMVKKIKYTCANK